MKHLGKISFQMICIAFISMVYGDMDVTLKNDTAEYALYIYSDYSVKVGPGESHELTLSEHQTVVVGMDSNETPTAWKYYGLGSGGISYSTDPVSGQSNFSFGIGPASVQPVPTSPAPSITLSGGVNMEGSDDWHQGLSLQPHGTNGATTVTFKDATE